MCIRDRMKDLEALDFSCVRSKKISSIATLAAKFPNLVKDIQELDTDWRILRNTEVDIDSENPTEFWNAVRNVIKGDGSPMFPKLSTFMRSLLCLPLSLIHI